VRAMIDAGAARAVMGNHELNAIAWATPDPDDGALPPPAPRRQGREEPASARGLPGGGRPRQPGRGLRD
jgi:hypothetical protein